MQVKDPIIFLTGTIIGSGVTYILTKTVIGKKVEEKYEKQYQEELQSVKDSFAYLAAEDKKKAEVAKNKPPLAIYTQALDQARAREAEADKNRFNYSNVSTQSRSDDADPGSLGEAVAQEMDEEDAPIDTTLIDETTDTSQPYILKRWPSTSESDYTQLEVTYYSDGTYADSRDQEMEIEEYIGKTMMDYIANTDKDEIFIRNDELSLDLDITKDARTYDEVMFG